MVGCAKPPSTLQIETLHSDRLLGINIFYLVGHFGTFWDTPAVGSASRPAFGDPSAGEVFFRGDKRCHFVSPTGAPGLPRRTHPSKQILRSGPKRKRRNQNSGIFVSSGGRVSVG